MHNDVQDSHVWVGDSSGAAASLLFESSAVREFVIKSAASAASPDYVIFQAVIKSAASAASLCGGRASGRLDHGYFSQLLKKYKKRNEISDSI